MYLRISSLIFLIFFSTIGMAENATKTGGYTIHHNAFTTDNLSEKVAKHYNIRRSQSRAMLNISVIKNKQGTIGTPVTAKVTATSRDLFGHVQTIPLREIKEQDAVYYIGDFGVPHRELLIFDIEALPTGKRYPLKAKMRQEFFTK